MLEIHLLPALRDNYIYLLHEPLADKTAVVDPGDAGPVMDLLQQQHWQLDFIFNTHHHRDHVDANLQLRQLTGCQIVASAADRMRIPGAERLLADGEIFQLGQESIKAIATPGHTLGHIVYHCETSQALFCGDTLFSLGCGRLFEGTAEQLWQSLQIIKKLPPNTRIFCAHEYTQANGRFAQTVEPDNENLRHRLGKVAELRQQNQPTLPSTLAEELACNPFLREDSVTIRQSLGLTGDAAPQEVFASLRRLKDNFH